MIPRVKPDWWTDNLKIADETVDVSSLVPELAAFLISAAAIHEQFYDKPLVVTSANDGNHAPGSKHYQWKAVDLRSHDLTDLAQDDFARQMIGLQRQYKVGIFDERFIGQSHWHVESE